LTDDGPRTTITNALLDAVPEDRMIQIRYPRYVRVQFTAPTAANAFGGSDDARVGLKNDCFLSTSNDGGTFTNDADIAYFEAASRWTVTGGETCQIAGVSERNDGANAVREMERFHYDYLNSYFYAPILDKWRSQGYYDEISRRLGYRYVLQGTIAEAATQPGDTFSLAIDVGNEGFGKLYNPRPIEIVLRPAGGGSDVRLRASNDARDVLPGPGEERTVGLTVAIPDGLPTGTYDVFLALPDAAGTLADDPRYAIRVANQGVWDAASGINALDVQVQVE
jgi:hypothetical protein